MIQRRLAAVWMLGLLGCVTAEARSTTATFGVGATLQSGCTVTAPPLSFGGYTAGGGSLAATTSIKVACSYATYFGVGLSAGSTTGTSFAQRLLGNGAGTLQYNLYTTSSHSAIWGDGSAGTSIIYSTSTGPSTPIALTVYGQLPDNATNQAAAPGAYSDTILVVISW